MTAPAPLERFANAAATTLNGAVTNAATSIVVSSAAGFPTQNVQAIQFRVLVDSEIMLVTGGFGTTTWTVTRGAEGTTAAAHSSGAAVNHLVTEGALERYAPNFGWQPRHNNLLLGSFDPILANTNLAYTSGFIILTKMWVPETVSVSNLLVDVGVAGSGLTAGESLAGVYGASGTLLCQTADQSSSWTSVGLKTMAITGAPVTITGGPDVFVWGSILNVGTTVPQFASISAANVSWGLAGGTINGTAANARAGYESAGGRTSLISIAGLQMGYPYGSVLWMGVT